MVALGRGERLRGLPFLPPPHSPDMTTPLGLSRQHLSYLQEIGSGWFGKVSGAGGEGEGGPYDPGLCSSSVSIPPPPRALLPPLLICPLPLSPPSVLVSVHLSPAPTCSIPPHLSVSASLLTPLTTLPRHLAIHTSVCPSFHPSLHPSDSGPVSLSLCICCWGTRAVGSEGRSRIEGGSWSHAAGWRWSRGWAWGTCRH